MKEIEVKAKINNVESVKKALLDLGCLFTDTLKQEDVIFLPMGVEFSNIIKGTPVVRVRNSNGVITLTLKKRIATEVELIKLEKEVVVNNKESAEKIVEHMGFHEVVRVAKERIESKYQDMTICIDNVSGLGYFIEAEKLSKDDDGGLIQKSLFDFLMTLGVAENDRITKGYDTLIHEANIE